MQFFDFFFRMIQDPSPFFNIQFKTSDPVHKRHITHSIFNVSIIKLPLLLSEIIDQRRNVIELHVCIIHRNNTDGSFLSDCTSYAP